MVIKIKLLKSGTWEIENKESGKNIAADHSSVAYAYVAGEGYGVGGDGPDVQVVHILNARQLLELAHHDLPVHLREVVERTGIHSIHITYSISIYMIKGMHKVMNTTTVLLKDSRGKGLLLM